MSRKYSIILLVLVLLSMLANLALAQEQARGIRVSIMPVEEAIRLIETADLQTLMRLRIARPEIDATVAVPVILDRVSAAGGVISPGDLVNVYMRSEGGANATATLVTRAARVLAIFQSTQKPRLASETESGKANLRATIELSEREEKVLSGSGSKSKQITYGGTITEALQVTSSGQEQYLSEKSYKTDILQILKAAAANRIDVSKTMAMLENYGLRLNQFEMVTQIADFDALYLVLLEVPKEEAAVIVQYNTREDNKIVLAPIPSRTKLLREMGVGT